MPITLQCKCGKRLKAPDSLAGRRVKCPGCGQPVAVPSPVEPPEESLIEVPTRENPCPGCGYELPRGAVLCTQCGINVQTGQRAATQTRAAKFAPSRKPRESSPWSLPALPALPIATILKILVPGAIIAVVAWWGYGFMNPPPVLGYEVQTVDSYAVVEGVEPIALAGQFNVLGGLSGDLALGGRHLLIVTHPSPSGRFLRLSLRLSKRYLANHDKIQRDKMYLSAADIQLLGPDSQPLSGVFLIGEQRPPSCTVNLQRLPENATLPFTGEPLDKWRAQGQAQGELKANFRIDGVLESITGQWDFLSPAGMKVRLGGDGKFMAVSWEPPAVAWRSAYDAEQSVIAFDTFGDWAINILFPRPTQGPYQLKIGDEVIPLP